MLDRTIKTEAIQQFKAHVHGELISPGDDGYESARRVWNGAIDKYPALIARCTDVSDVVSAVQFARAQELPVSVRGGGIGWLMGEYGLTIDNLLAVEIVTAEGQVLSASASEHADLFWGMRGGGGNFGIVTDFKFQLHPVGPLLVGVVAYPLDRAR